MKGTRVLKCSSLVRFTRKVMGHINMVICRVFRGNILMRVCVGYYKTGFKKRLRVDQARVARLSAAVPDAGLYQGIRRESKLFISEGLSWSGFKGTLPPHCSSKTLCCSCGLLLHVRTRGPGERSTFG